MIMQEQDKPSIAERLEDSKARFSDKLAELGRRVDALQDRTHELQALAKKPLVVFGAAVALGLWLGSRGGRSPIAVATPDGTVRIERPQPGLLRAVVREVVLVSAGAWTRKYLNKRLSGA
jgi:hypothetical protein